MLSKGLDLYFVYRILRGLTMPFEKWDAFKDGIIDKDGNILKKKNDRTESEARSFTSFDLMIRNMKRLLAKIPGGGSQFATFAAALFLLKESAEPDENFRDYRKEEALNEIIANSIGAAGVYMYHDPEELFIDNEKREDFLNSLLQADWDDNPYWEDLLKTHFARKDINSPDENEPPVHRDHKANVEVQTKKHMLKFKAFMKQHGHHVKEEAPVNNVGGGNVAGMNGEQTKPEKIARRKKINILTTKI